MSNLRERDLVLASYSNLKSLEQNKSKTPQNRCQEIIKLGAKFNKIGTKTNNKKSMKQIVSLYKSTRLINQELN